MALVRSSAVPPQKHAAGDDAAKVAATIREIIFVTSPVRDGMTEKLPPEAGFERGGRVARQTIGLPFAPVPETSFHHWATWVYLGLAAATFVFLSFVVAPYGRHARKGFGPTVPVRLGWFLMESPAVFAWAAIYFLGRHALEPMPLVLLALWQLHYLQRVVLFPLTMRPGGHGTPWTVVASAVAFNLGNAYVNARWVSELGAYPTADLTSVHFVAGAALFLVGFGANVRADRALARLRSPGESAHKIPHGGLFEWVSCPNYLAEIVEWCGWAIATWSLAGTAFALYTAANLVPRAISHHAWYKRTFADYPAERRALVPYVL